MFAPALPAYTLERFIFVTVIGVELEPDVLVLQRGRDFRWSFVFEDENGVPANFPAGRLYFEFCLNPPVQWEFTIAGGSATLKVESEEADKIEARTKWQLVWLPDGETNGGDPVAFGTVKVQGGC